MLKLSRKGKELYSFKSKVFYQKTSKKSYIILTWNLNDQQKMFDENFPSKYRSYLRMFTKG